MKTLAISVGVVLAILLGIGAVASHTQNQRDDGAEVAGIVGASSCARTGLELADDGNGTHPEIYDCVIDGQTRCVTYLRGVATDETATVRRLFAGILGSRKRPDCL